MKIAKLFLYMLIVFVIVPVFAFAVLFMLNGNIDFADTLEGNWDITLSDDSRWEVVYQASEGASFHGDGIRYHVVAYHNEDMIANMVNWTAQEGATRWHNTYRESANAWLQEINADLAEYPQYDACQYYYQNKSDRSEIILFWNAKQDIIYAVESFY